MAVPFYVQLTSSVNILQQNTLEGAFNFAKVAILALSNINVEMCKSAALKWLSLDVHVYGNVQCLLVFQ